jgi:hypothetical protein
MIDLPELSHWEVAGFAIWQLDPPHPTLWDIKKDGTAQAVGFWTATWTWKDGEVNKVMRMTFKHLNGDQFDESDIHFVSRTRFVGVMDNGQIYRIGRIT